MIESISPRTIPEHLLAEGRFWFTTAEASELLERPPRVLYPRLAELERDAKIFSPAKGLYVVVPPEYRSWGVVPGEWFIDPLMRHLGRDYYVSFLTAAARHGAAHQAPQEFQSVVDRQLRDRDVRRVRLRFISSKWIPTVSREAVASHTGTYEIASRETTAVDLCWRPRHGGGISNVATVLRELGALDGEPLARIASARGRGTARRLGWLLERFRPDVDTFWLREVARPEDGAPAVLVPGNPVRGKVDQEWGLRLNGAVEPDRSPPRTSPPGGVTLPGPTTRKSSRT